MPSNDNTYGFNHADAAGLIDLLGGGEHTYVEGRVRATGGPRLYRFSLNAIWSSGAADADILRMDGTDTNIDADVLDPEGIFGELGVGNTGLCIRQGNSYYVIQAPCPS